MAAPKTRPTKASVSAYLTSRAGNAEQLRDARTVSRLMREATGARPVMWGPSIVGFGECELAGARGRTTTWPEAAFALRGSSLVVYIMPFKGRQDLLRQLGKHTIGVSCLYIRRLADVRLPVLVKLVRGSMAGVRG